MKRIIHLVTTSQANGLEHVVMDICNLVGGYEHLYVSPSGEINEYLKNYGIRHVIVRKITPCSVRKIIKKYHPDVVNGHDVKASLCLALNSKYCKNNNITQISVLHNDDLRMHHKGIRSFLYNWSSKYYDYVVGVSKDVINNYIYSYNIANKCVVIDNIVNPLVVSELSKKKSDVSSDVIFVGRLEDQKNPLLFVKIIKAVSKKIPGIQAVMLGQGSLKNRVKKFIIDNEMEENITLIGFQHNPYKFIKKSKIMLMTSKYEGFGLVALESLMLCKPVVCTSVTGLKDIVNDNCGLVSNEVEDLINAVVALMTDQKLYMSKSKKAYQRAKEINRIDEFVEKYSKIYEISSDD